MNSIIQISTTSDQKSELEKISGSLLKNGLAACCQISGPISSHYCWQGKLQNAEEWICTIKTDQRLFAQVEKVIQEIHHYDEPEIIAVEISDSSAGYRKWINDSVTK